MHCAQPSENYYMLHNPNGLWACFASQNSNGSDRFTGDSDDALTPIRNHMRVFVQNDEVIGIADDRCPTFLGCAADQSFFKAMQRDVGEQGQVHAPSNVENCPDMGLDQKVNEDAQGVPARRQSSYSLCLHAQTHLLAQSGRDSVQYSRTPSPETCQLRVGGQTTSTASGLY